MVFYILASTEHANKQTQKRPMHRTTAWSLYCFKQLGATYSTIFAFLTNTYTMPPLIPFSLCMPDFYCTVVILILGILNLHLSYHPTYICLSPVHTFHYSLPSEGYSSGSQKLALKTLFKERFTNLDLSTYCHHLLKLSCWMNIYENLIPYPLQHEFINLPHTNQLTARFMCLHYSLTVTVLQLLSDSSCSNNRTLSYVLIHIHIHVITVWACSHMPATLSVIMPVNVNLNPICRHGRDEVIWKTTGICQSIACIVCLWSWLESSWDVS